MLQELVETPSRAMRQLKGFDYVLQPVTFAFTFLTLMLSASICWHCWQTACSDRKMWSMLGNSRSLDVSAWSMCSAVMSREWE